MFHPPGQRRDDWRQVQMFLAGQTPILEHLVKTHGPALLQSLVRRGATHAEAEDLIAGVWSDCVLRPDATGSLLEKYNGQTTLTSWLLTVATRRLIDLKRRQRFV